MMVSEYMFCDFFTYFFNKDLYLESFCMNFISFCVTNAMEQNPTWEADSPCVLGKL